MEIVDALRLKPRQRAIFSALLRHPGRAIPHDVLIDAVWSDDPTGGPVHAMDCLRVHISGMRRALAGTPYRVERVFGVGYRLIIEDGRCPTCGRAA